MRPRNLAWHVVGCVQCAANDHFTRLFLIYFNQHEVCIVQSPTWFSFQVSRQFLLSHFLAPLCLIITLIMFSDRITTVSLNTSLYVPCWPPLAAGVNPMVSPLSATTPTTDSKLVTGDLDSSLANLASNLNFGPAANRFVGTLEFLTFWFLNLGNFQEFRWSHC